MQKNLNYHPDAKHCVSVKFKNHSVFAGRQGKSSLEMLRLSCEQLQVKTPNSMRPLQEQKTGTCISDECRYPVSSRVVSH